MPVGMRPIRGKISQIKASYDRTSFLDHCFPILATMLEIFKQAGQQRLPNKVEFALNAKKMSISSIFSIVEASSVI